MFPADNKDVQSARIIHWLERDSYRMDALEVASRLGLKDWCLAAGFVRNLVWDRLHGYSQSTPLNDIDLIYFDPEHPEEEFDREHEAQLHRNSRHPWSVKNQARMHLRNEDAPYVSTSDAMSYWVEVETAVGARLTAEGSISLVAPFGLEALFSGTVTLNRQRPKLEAFQTRVNSKKWLALWPCLKLIV